MNKQKKQIKSDKHNLVFSYQSLHAIHDCTATAMSFGTHGPSAHIRVDYQHDICKDYIMSGYCGFGDAYKFVHIREDHKMSECCEIEKALGDGSEHECSPLPVVCSICCHSFGDPVVTKCKHCFCQHCALEHHSKRARCFVCNETTLGIFNTAFELKKKIKVMSVEDHNVWEELVASVISDDHSSEPLSPEDAAWVDSCLVKNPELSESDWDAMKDALLDIVGIETPSDHRNPVSQNSSLERESDLDVLMTEVTQNAFGAKDYHVEDSSVQYPGETDNDFGLNPEKEDSGLSRGFLLKDKSKFLDQKRGKKTEVEPESSLANEIEFPYEDIFKVWDLNTASDEADEFVKQLEKALEGTPLTTEPPVLDNSSGNVDLGTLDDLISSFTDLSLHPLSAS